MALSTRPFLLVAAALLAALVSGHKLPVAAVEDDPRDVAEVVDRYPQPGRRVFVNAPGVLRPLR